MARGTTAKKTTSKSTISTKEVEEFLKDKKQCSNCGKILDMTRGFYMSYSRINKYNSRMNICKECLNSLLLEYITESEDIKIGIYKTCRAVGTYYTEDIFNDSYGAIGYNPKLGLAENGLNIWKEYIKNTNSLKQNVGKTFDDGQQLNLDNDKEDLVNVVKPFDELELEKELEFKRNKDDIIKILGYYPFEGEENQDLLCGQLVTFLGDEDIKDDAIKLNAIISIIRTQRAVDIISKSLSDKTKDLTKLDDQLGSIKQMTAIQKDLSKTILDTAKDNKLTDLWSGKKTAGANTLTGTLYKLRQINLDDAQVNLYDIKTSLGMEQVAKQSARGIVENLNWGDDASMDMIKEQRVLIDKYYKLYISLKEENRKLKVICHLNNVDYTTDNYLHDVEWEDIPSVSEVTREYVDKIIEENEQRISALEDMEKSIKPTTVIQYADKIIEEEKELAKQKLLEEIDKN
ncbi:hypothetical protein [uncultured Clostridium sp.]|uniref:hypothetical protein n=1 Tax=uncultured Clostridium sp. TaxID=59620 RepID=UPI00261BA61D|nr:hypothetical protein [uncultured Clostridium sp.]